jgi:hypothetical protein
MRALGLAFHILLFDLCLHYAFPRLYLNWYYLTEVVFVALHSTDLTFLPLGALYLPSAPATMLPYSGSVAEIEEPFESICGSLVQQLRLLEDQRGTGLARYILRTAVSGTEREAPVPVAAAAPLEAVSETHVDVVLPASPAATVPVLVAMSFVVEGDNTPDGARLAGEISTLFRLLPPVHGPC